MAHPGDERGTVWVLEDSALEAEMARRALAPSHVIELFADPQVVIERAGGGALPDVLVVDWQLPGMTGVEVCTFLRARHDEMSLPILILTAYGRKQDLVEALYAGANDYLTKPYDVMELAARVATLVRTSKLQQVQTRRARHLALTADVGAALGQEGGGQQMAERVAEAIVHHLRPSSAVVWLNEGGRMEPAASAGPGPVPPDSLICGIAPCRGRVTVGGSPPDAGPAVALYPLLLGAKVEGALTVSGSTLGRDDEDVLVHVADLLSLGLARLRAEQERAALLVRERAARAEAETANRGKDEFLAMVSHELRTPLNAITGWTSMLLSGSVEPDRVPRALQTIDRNARMQAQLINDLLDISRIISGKLHLNVGAIDLASVVEMARESVRLSAEAKGVHLEVDIAPEVGPMQGDPERLQQVVWNLLSNAIKFTPTGGVVGVSVERVEREAEIRVTDTGAGIPPDFLPHVFERFRQAEMSSVRSKGGLGLGLAITRQLVELHGGTIRAESEGTGKGATFIVCLPVDLSPRVRTGRAMSDSARLERPTELVGLRVLVVDDEEDARDLVRSLLESCAALVQTVGSADEALTAVRSAPPDILVSDVAMPMKDGLTLVRELRALPRDAGGRVPAVALTAFARVEDRTAALRAGFDGYVAKPIEPAELLAVLSSVLPARP